MPLHVRNLVPSLIVAVLAVTGGCTPDQPHSVEDARPKPDAGQFVMLAGHTPPFSQRPYGRFTRAEVVAIAQQEWRLFGQRVKDEPPQTNDGPDAEETLQRFPGLWERIGEYWWLGQNANRREAAWTGMHDETGQEIDDSRADNFAWSAAFVSYVMRTAGAGARFPYAPSHYVYINTAKEMRLDRSSGWVVMAERVDDYAPAAGDLICYWRGKRRVTFQILPLRRFPAHCDIVVHSEQGQISVIGGNVGAAVAMKHVPVTAAGRFADPTSRPLDTRYPWFVVLRILYDR